MPADRPRRQKKKQLPCDYGDCGKIFTRPYDLRRHQRTHCEYEERQFACLVEGCTFRANQEAGLRCHMNSIHDNSRLTCDQPGCEKTFSDPSSRTKHKQKFHAGSTQPRGTPLGSSGGEFHQRKTNAPNPVAVHARVARHVAENSTSGQDAKNILSQFAAFALDGSAPSTRTSPCPSDPPSDNESCSTSGSAPCAISSIPSTSTFGADFTMPSSSKLPQNAAPTVGVTTFDNNAPFEHQHVFKVTPSHLLQADACENRTQAFCQSSALNPETSGPCQCHRCLFALAQQRSPLL